MTRAKPALVPGRLPDGYLDPPAEAWMTSAQVAARLRVAPSTILNWAKAGILPHRRTLGGRYQFTTTACDAIADGRDPWEATT